MSLPSLQLDAFHMVARSLNFSRAAKELHITQSALTQRVQNLEEELETALFVRHPRGVHLTEAGERLLLYCQTREGLEQELCDDIQGRSSDDLAGILRIASFSSVTRSVLLPSLADLLRDHDGVIPILMNAEMRDLPPMLLRNEVDYIIVDHEIDRAGLEAVFLGFEENVMVTSRDHTPPKSVFLDHDPDDPTTLQFFKQQANPVPKYTRRYFDEIYGIIDGVALGLGKAIVPKHIAKQDPRIKIQTGYKPLEIPTHLHYRLRPYYTKLHSIVVDTIVTNAKKYLR